MAGGSVRGLIRTERSPIMGPSIPLQTWALIRRYLITLTRFPISSLIRLILWPGLALGLSLYLLHSMTQEGSYGKDSNPILAVPFVVTLLTLFHVRHFTEWLVNDKSTGVKSLMISMGLKSISYYLGNSVCFAVSIMPLMIAIGVISLVYLMEEASYLAVMTIFILFVLHLLAWVFTFASFITSTGFASLTIILVMLERFVHEGIHWIMKKSSDGWRPIVLFMASLSPYESLRIMCESYKLCKEGCGTKFDAEKNLVAQPVYLILIAMAVWTVVMFAFARWFEEVCPWQYDTAVKSPLFCFQCDRKSAELEDSNDETEPESRYFEKPTGRREVGISIRKVTKTFRNIPVVNDLSFKIFKGETTLLLGHNGAGKTTLMNIVLNRLTPDEGRVFIKKSGSMTSSRDSVGVCPQLSILDANLNVRQHLELFANIKSSGMSGRELDSHIKSTIEDVSLTSHMYKLPAELSGGMKRKLSLGMAFIGKSQILILDEPSSGLDPDSRVSVWNVIRRYRSDRTVLLSTQHMEEADYLGDRIAIMSAGRLVCCGSSIFLNKIFGNGYKLRVECHASKQKQILAYVRKYFHAAKPSEVDQAVSPPHTDLSSKKDPIQDMVIELTDDKSKDLETNLINMLEDIEAHSRDLHMISHGLKSSSLEDVMLNTGKIFESTSPASVKVRVSAPGGHISTLSNPSRVSSKGCFSDFNLFLCAFMAKHFNTYKRDWKSIFFYRIAIPTLSVWLLVNDMGALLTPFQPDFLSTFMIVHFIYYPTSERVTKFKTMQLTSHASFTSYWISQYLTDLVTILILAFDINLFLSTTFGGYFLSSKLSVHLIATLTMILFGTSAAFLAYILSTIMNNYKASVGYHTLLYSFGVIISLSLSILTLFVSAKFAQAQDVVGYILIAVVPTSSLRYVLVDGLKGKCYIGPANPFVPQPLPCSEVDYWSPISAGLIALSAQIVVYGGILYIIERANIDLSLYFSFRNICSCARKAPIVEPQDIDKDVFDESNKAAALIDKVPEEHYSLIAANLSKSYQRGVKVVNHLSFTVNKGECFGLLGVNGAGKTTTFSMLVAETPPDEGQIWMNGRYLSKNVDKYRQKLGYDPQDCPEFSLSPIEALHLMARLRRINELNIPMLVSSVLELLEMTEHSSKSAINLSGGTKRKLSLGMSLIGNPLLLALDEPTAGIDPIARRGIWHLLRTLRLQNGTSIIISSHAMEECEAICDRISIMARGRLRCIGSFLHLRSKYAQGCSVRTQFSTSGSGEIDGGNVEIINQATSELSHKLESIVGSGKVKLADRNINSATFNLLDNTVKRSSLFKILRELHRKYPSMSYMINDSSLEDIFIELAREQQRLEAEAASK